MKLKLVTYPNPILSQKSKKITIIDESIKKLVADMAETVASYGSEHEAGVALAAIQVGVPLRMTVVKQEDNSYFALINPEVIKSGKDETDEIEGCMSVPHKYGHVRRAGKIKIKGLNIEGKKIEIKAEGLMARILQHEIDHMNGHLFTTKVDGDIYKLQKDGQLER